MSEDKIKAIEERRAKRKEALERQRVEQYAADLEALDALEQEYGDNAVAALNVDGYIQGQPTFAVVRSPGGTAFYKRYTDMVRRAGKDLSAIGKAQDMLGDACIVYPSEGPARDSMYEAFPGLRITAALRALEFVELKAADAKKD